MQLAVKQKDLTVKSPIPLRKMGIRMSNDPSILKNQAYINGEWVSAINGETLAVMNPSTGEEITQIAKYGTTETKYAVESASQVLIEFVVEPFLLSAPNNSMI
jgi:hypothetical protein